MEYAGREQQSAINLPPPANYYSGRTSSVVVSCSCHVSGLGSETLTSDKRVLVEVAVQVKHLSVSEPPGPTSVAYETIQDFSVPFDELCRRDTITTLLDLLCIPFSLNDGVFGWHAMYLLGSSEYRLDCRSSTLENSEGLVTKLMQFFRSTKGLTRVSLLIFKSYALPNIELEAWNSWERERRMEFMMHTHVWPMMRMRRYMAVVVEIERLRITRFGSGEDIPETCSICLQDFQDATTEVLEEGLSRLRCGHVYHKNCILRWLKNAKNSCPYCRMEAVSFPVSHEQYAFLNPAKCIDFTFFLSRTNKVYKENNGQSPGCAPLRP